MSSAPSVVSEDTPVLEASDAMLDACTPSSMPAPGGIAENATAAEDRRDELGDTSVASVRQHATVMAAQALDERATVVHRVIAIPSTTACGRRCGSVRRRSTCAWHDHR